MTGKLRWAALAVFLSITCGVRAEVLTFDLTGTVYQSMPMASEGQPVTVRFSYNPSTKPRLAFGDKAGPGPGWSSYLIKRPLKVKVNGHTIECSIFYVEIQNDSGSNTADLLDIGCQPTLDGTLLAQAWFNIRMASAYDETRALRSTALPRELTLKRFNNFTEGDLNIDGTDNGYLLLFNVTRIVKRSNDDDGDDD